MNAVARRDTLFADENCLRALVVARWKVSPQIEQVLSGVRYSSAVVNYDYLRVQFSRFIASWFSIVFIVFSYFFLLDLLL